jgi:hypothetical protein
MIGRPFGSTRPGMEMHVDNRLARGKNRERELDQ